MGNDDGLDFVLGEQRLLLREDLLEEVFVDLVGGRQVVLNYKKREDKKLGLIASWRILTMLVQVVVEIQLGLQPTLQLIGHHEVQAALLAL